MELEIRVVELKMKKKRTQTIENTTEDELKMTAEAEDELKMTAEAKRA